jgi:hypothetical protein
MGGQPGEADSAHGAALDLSPASGEIHPHDVAGRRLCLTREMTVDEQVHRAVRALRHAHQYRAGPERVELDHGRPSAKDQPNAGGLRLRGRQVGVATLRACSGREPVGQPPPLGSLQFGQSTKEGDVNGVGPHRTRRLSASSSS